MLTFCNSYVWCSNVKDIETKRKEASVLALFYYQSETNLAYSKNFKAKRPLLIPDIRKIEGKRTLLIPYNRKIKANQSLLIQELKKIEAKQTRLIPEIGKIEAKKTELDRSKTNRGCIFKTFMEPRNRFRQPKPWRAGTTTTLFPFGS